MATAQSNIAATPLEPGPAWDIARLFPDQGDISEYDYLKLTEHTNRMAEWKDGRIELLPMPTTEHQQIVLFLITLLQCFVVPRKLGIAMMAPLRVRIVPGQFREPDVVFLLECNALSAGSRYWDRADLVMEVVSEDDPDRDWIDKRLEYARAGILEYWIVDRRTKTIVVLRLEDGHYVSTSQAVETGIVHSALLGGFTANVAAVFAAAERHR